MPLINVISFILLTATVASGIGINMHGRKAHISPFEDTVLGLKGEAHKGPKQLEGRDCKELLDSGATKDGIYTIRPTGLEDLSIQVRCDMTNGGWIVFQKRYDGSVDFNRTFEDYSKGFGNLNGEFWMGLNDVHAITQIGKWKLRIDLESFDNKRRYAEYNDFRVGAGRNFTLYFNQSSYEGTAGDSLWFHHGMKFTTMDMDEDDSHCANLYGGGGGWWYEDCVSGMTNGMPYGEVAESVLWEYGPRAIFWDYWKADEVLKASELKFRPA